MKCEACEAFYLYSATSVINSAQMLDSRFYLSEDIKITFLYLLLNVIINRGYLLFWGEYQIYFIECGEKNQYFSRVRSTSENADIFTARDEIYLVFAKKKVNFLFILYSTEIQRSQPYFLLVRFSFDLTFAVCLLGITLGVNVVCT